MKLYDFSWGPYPQRVTIYLKEKGISDIEIINIEPPLEKKDWPPAFLLKLNPAGSLPVLEVGDGTVIRQSLAILDYFEERLETPTMIGITPAARAATRELVSVFDEATPFFGIWARHGSRLNFGSHKPSREAAVIGAERYAMKLRLAESLIVGGRFLAGETVTLADCVAMALLQFTDKFYGVPLPVDCPKLSAWYARFAKRPSFPHPPYPPAQLSLAYGLQEQTNYML